jgi:hypothetical protein
VFAAKTGTPASSPREDNIYTRLLGVRPLLSVRGHTTIIGGSPEEEAHQALLMGPTARLIEEKNPVEATRQTIAREIEAAFAAEASAGPIRLPATIFLVAARRPT